MTPGLPRLSLRLRLVMLYTGLLAGALTVFGGGGFLVLRDQLQRSFDAGLQANAEHAGGAFALDVAPDGSFRPSGRLLEQLASTGGRVLVLDPQGRPVADSAGSGAAPSITGGDLRAAAQRRYGVRAVRLEGQPYHIAVEPILSGTAVVGYVAWANPTAGLDDLLRTVGGALFLGGLALVLVALIVGWILVGRALAPMVEVTDTARAISLSGDFAARVPTQPRPDEVGELAVAFNEMLAALEESHQALQRFLGDASHQLRTPLTSIRANLDLALRPDLPEGERSELLQDASGEAARMAGLVADLLSLARADAGVRLTFQPVQLDEVLVECVRQQATSAEVAVTLTDAEPVRVLGDRDRLKDLFLVLLDNAARYTQPGGRVSARLERRDSQAVVTVDDTGIGLVPEEIPHLFDRLYRGERARSLRPAGTGLGLAIGRWIAEAHGGRVELQSRDGGGTTAQVTLPALD